MNVSNNRIFCRLYSLQYAHVNTQKCQVEFPFEVFQGNKQILHQNSNEHTQKGFKFTPYSAINLEEN